MAALMDYETNDLSHVKNMMFSSLANPHTHVFHIRIKHCRCHRSTLKRPVATWDCLQSIFRKANFDTFYTYTSIIYTYGGVQQEQIQLATKGKIVLSLEFDLNFAGPELTPRTNLPCDLLACKDSLLNCLQVGEWIKFVKNIPLQDLHYALMVHAEGLSTTSSESEADAEVDLATSPPQMVPDNQNL